MKQHANGATPTAAQSSLAWSCCADFRRYRRHDVDCPWRNMPVRTLRMTPLGRFTAFRQKYGVAP